MKKKMSRIVATCMIFVMCISNMNFVAWAEDNMSYTSKGYTYVINDDNTATITGCDDSISGSVKLPDVIDGFKVTAIGEKAFYSNSNIQKINIPEGVKKIEKRAFDSCTYLTKVEIADSVTVIEPQAFFNCDFLSDIKLPPNLTEIADYLFCYCKSLETVKIPDKITSIGHSAFYHCESLVSIDIPQTVTEIESSAFYNCNSLEKVVIPEGVSEIKRETFYSCENLNSLKIPNTVTSIGVSAFSYCSSLKKLELPEVVDYIGSDCFCGCSSLEDINMPCSLKEIEDSTFSGCKSLSNIEIPKNVISIGEYAFNNCKRLEKVFVPRNVEFVFDNAFKNCNNLLYIIIENSECIIFDAASTLPTQAIIYGAYNSTAKIYAEKYGREFKNCVHDNLIIYSYKEATCEEDGYEEAYYCPDCNQWIWKVVIPSKGHLTETEYVTTNKAGINKYGEKRVECQNNGCAYAHTKIIDSVDSPTLSYSITTYNGKTRTPKIEIKDCSGNCLKKGIDYDVNWNDAERMAIGRYYVTITFKGDYEGKVTKSFKINPKKISKATLGTTSYYYNGSTKKPTVTVKAGDKVILSAKKTGNSNVSLSYASGRKKPGTYKVSIKGKGNYTGTITKTFKIKVKNTSVKSLTKGSKRFTVKWSKLDSKYITGYQIRYSKNSSMSNAKKTTLISRSTTSKTIKGLSAKKKYYVQIRTYKKIDGKIYYSDWSTKKMVTTKS